MDGWGLDVDPPNEAALGIPQRALAQLGARWRYTFDLHATPLFFRLRRTLIARIILSDK
jgi:hypothetical protein